MRLFFWIQKQGRSPLAYQRPLLQSLGYGLGLLVYGLVIQITLPPAVTSALVIYRPFLALLAFTGWLLSGYQKHRWEPYVSFGLTLILFGLPLMGLWSTGGSNPALIGGVLPWSDTTSYFRIAHRLLDGEAIALGFSRPFFPGFLAVLLGLTQRNLMAVQALLTGAVAIACYLASREIRRSHGNLAAVIVLTGVFVFYTPYLGSLMTESLGLVLGGLSFAVLWRGGAQRREGLVLLGIFLLTLGLCARMGAILILPLVLMWGDRLFRRQGTASYGFVLKGSGLIFLGLGLNTLVSYYISDGQYISFGNYSYVLYGLLTGGNWERISQDHPEVMTLPMIEQVQKIYALCFELIRQDPLSLLRGITRAWGNMLSAGTERLLVRITQGVPLWILTNGVVRPLLGLGLLISLLSGRPWGKKYPSLQVPFPAYGLLLAYGGGTLLSAPLAPVWDAVWRPYATTMIGYYALVGIGAWGIVNMGQQFWNRPSSAALGGSWLSGERYPVAAVLGLLLTGVVVLSPLAMKGLVSPRVAGNNPCLAGVTPTAVYIHPATAVHLYEDGAIARSHVPNLRISDFRNGLQQFRRKRLDMLQGLSHVRPDQTLLPSHNSQARLLLIGTRLMPEQAGHYIACGQEEPFSSVPASIHKFLRVSSLHPEQPS